MMTLQPRRLLLPVLVLTGLTLYIAAPPRGGGVVIGAAWAEDDSGGNDGNGRESGRKDQRKTVVITVPHLLDLSTHLLRRAAIKANDDRGDPSKPIHVIKGFSESMSSYIWDGLEYKPRVFKRLLKRLKGVTDNKKRIAILNDERDKLKREIEARQKSIEKFKKLEKETKNPELREQYRSQWRTDAEQETAAKYAVEDIDTWIKFPHEGKY